MALNASQSSAPDEMWTPEELSRVQSLLDMLHGSWRTQAVCVAAELRLADLLADGPQSAEQLAAETGTHGPAMHRLLSALTTLDVCSQLADGKFQITPTGSLLASDHPGSVRNWAIWWGRHLWPVWEHLLHSVETGQSARTMLLGTERFDHLEADEDGAAVFNAAMAELTRMTARSLVQVYDFSACDRIVDLGGGYGELLAVVLRRYPDATGVLVDLPHTMDGARRRIEEEGLTSRCELIAGDVFEEVPAGADAYLLKTVLHDFGDEDVRRILESCHRAMSGQARLLIIERLVPDRPEVSAAHESVARSDLNMLVATGGQERTRSQMTELLKSCGLVVRRVLTAGFGFSVIEAGRGTPTTPRAEGA